MGFDNECILNIQNLAGEYFCPVCRMLVYPNEALQSQCTHLYCKPCLTYIVATTRACPYDGYLVTNEDSKPLLESNKTLAETIGKIAVHCLYRRSGCTWQGSLSDCVSHCSACAFGNSPVVCNRCAIQIVHRQVQEHAQSCPGVPSQGRTTEGTQSSAVAASTNQIQATSSQAHASHLTTASIPGQVPDQPVNPNLNFPLYAQAALPVSDLSHHQQHHQLHAAYDPYQQHYQQLQHPHLQHQPQLQSLPQPQVQALPQQQQPPSVVHTQPPAKQYPQSQAISVSHQQNQSHPMIHPQSHSHFHNHSLAQPLPNQPQLHPHAPQHSQLHPQQLRMSQYQQNHPQAQTQLQPQPHIHLQAQPPVQNSQVHPHAYPPQANYMNHYPSISHTHSYHLQSQSGAPQQPSGYPYSQEGHYQQQQHALNVQNQVSLPVMNPTELQSINQQNPSVMTSSSQHQIVPTTQQPNLSHHERLHMLHHRLPMQASGQALAPQQPQQQQVPVSTHAPVHSQLHSNVPLLMPRQNVVFPRNELPHQSQSEIGRDCEQLQTFPVTTEGVASSGLHKQPGTQNGSQSEPNNVSAENIAATGHLEGKETSLTVDKPTEALPAMSAAGNEVPSEANGVKEERVNDSEEHNSIGRSGSVSSDLKEGDPDKINSKRMDSQNIQPANEKDEVAGSFPQALDSDRQTMVNAFPYVFKGKVTMPSSLVPHPRKSFDERQPYIHHSGSINEANLTPASLKAGPDSLYAFGWRDEGFRAPKDKILLEQGSIRVLREEQTPRPPNVESELIRKHGGFFSSMSYEKDSFGVRMIPRHSDKTLYGLHHDKHLQPGAIPGDNRLDISLDFQNAASIYGRHFGVPQTIPDREHPNMSSHAIRYGSRTDFRLGIDRRDQSLLAPVKPLNLLSDTADLSFISSASSNLHPHLHRGSFSGQTHNVELSGHGSISSLGEVGYRSNLLLTDNQLHKGDLELYANIRKRKAATMGWCRICKVDCDTVEGLDLHLQTREHQRMSMDMVWKIKQQNSKRLSMTSSEFDPLPRKQSSQDH